jgi:hypothetical protein
MTKRPYWPGGTTEEYHLLKCPRCGRTKRKGPITADSVKQITYCDYCFQEMSFVGVLHAER